MTNGESGLSSLQRGILVCVLEWTAEYERRIAAIADNDRRAYVQREYEWTGVRWDTHPLGDASYSAADRVTLSKSLRRLEERSLIIRCNDISGANDGSPGIRMRADQPPPKRTLSVKLTDAGRLCAERLTMTQTVTVSHCDGKEAAS